jgi:DNA processing protein
MLVHWMQLSLTEGIGPILARRVIAAAGGIEAACEAPASLLTLVDGIGSARAGRIASSLRQSKEAAERELEQAQARGIAVICPDDEAYPLLLKTINDPPLVLYMRGELQDRDLNAFAMVGSRRCGQYGREQAERFAALLAGSGFTIISGGARGIDSFAHQGALTHPQGRTIGVLGSGVDVPYPPENAALFDRIAERGAILSEYPLGTQPTAENFPRRNRIVSGMSRGVLVVEADIRSGALITARLAIEDHNRPVFAIPGRVDNPLAAGPHALIRDGAILVRGMEDIIEGLHPLPQEAHQPTLFEESPAAPVSAESGSPSPKAAQAPELAALSERQQLILSHMDREAAGVDALVERSGLPVHEIMQELTLLSLKGVIRRRDGQSYSKVGPRD